MRRIVTATALLVAVMPAEPVFACATCMAGDPTITSMGTEKPFAGRKRIGVDYLTRGEIVAQPGVSELETDEQRVTYNFSYALNTEWMFAASMPMVTKKVKRYDLSEEQGSGLGDTDLSARWFVGRDESFPAKYLWGLQFGLRVPTSSEQKESGATIDIDAQPGVGATIPSVGIWYGRYAMPLFFYISSSVQVALTEGYQGYQAGDVALLTTMAQYAVSHEFAANVSLDGRFKDNDSYDGVKDEDSGGVLIMLTPGLAWTPLEDLVLNMSYQYPLIENANGRQEEDPMLRVGVAYDF